MTTKYKIIIGFTLMGFLLIAVAVLGYVKLQEASSGFTHYRIEASTAVNANGADALMRNVQDCVSRFRLDLNEAHMEKAQELIERALGYYMAGAKEVERNPEELARLDRQIDRIKTLGRLMEVVREKLLAASNQADTRITASAQDLNSLMSEISQAAGKAGNAMLLVPIDLAYSHYADARASVREYVDLFDEEVALRADKSLGKLSDALDVIERATVSEDTKGALARMRKDHVIFVEEFGKAKTQIREALKAQSEIDKLGQEMVKDFDAYTANAEKNMAELGKSLQASNDQAQTLMLMFSGGGILLGLAFAAWIVFSITRVLNQVSSFAAAITNGRFEAKLDVHEKGEIGVMVDSMRAIPATLTSMMAEYERLQSGVEEGHLNALCDTTQFSGDFARLVRGTNGILARLCAVINNLPSPVLVLDRHLRTNFLNTAGQQLAGSDYVGKTCQDLFCREDYGSASCALMNATKNGRPAFAETVASPRGKRMDISYTAIPFFDERKELSCVLELIVDVTAIKDSERRMLQVAEEAMLIAGRVAAASEQLSAQVEQVSRGAEMQRARVESTATAMHEMNATVLEVARNASFASEKSEETRKRAEDGADLVDKVVHSINGVNSVALGLQENMQGLGRQAENIGGVMNVISDIADQTNLLALNAAIEAARAGEAGRGFAVVADEVRKLAEKTMSATQEVGSSIQAIQNSANTNILDVINAVKNITEATELANASGATLHDIVTLATSNSSVVSSIATAAEEQSATSEEINCALDDVSRVVAETSEGMSQSSSAVHDLAETAQALKRVMERLH